MFNEKQLEAINNLEGRVRVIAGAGSGKTSVLTARYVELIKKGIRPENILCVTFTNKAANEMKERISKQLGENDYLINTFHGFCLKLLRENSYILGYPNNFAILDGEDQTQILKNVFKDCKISYEEVSYKTAKDIIADIKINTEYYLLNVFKPDETIKKKYDEAKKEYKQAFFNKNKALKDCIYFGYLYYQQKATGMDFNDMIILACIILKQCPNVLSTWQDKLKYIMVDEFQDVSQRQYELVSMLSEKSNNLFVVGDPDQTIYSWRGAKPEILVNFDKDKPTKTIIMNENYRSTPNILKVANDIISVNELRVEKDLFTKNPEGSKVLWKHFENPRQEAEWIATSIKNGLKRWQPKDIVILYRAHYLSRTIEEQLIRNRIPYVIHSGTNFYERKEIKDILTYLKLIVNLNDDVALERIINVPTRGIGKKTLDDLKQYSEMKDCSMWEACNHFITKGNSKLQNFVMLIRLLKSQENLSIYELTKEILDKSGYNDLLEDSLEKERTENIKEFLSGLKELEDTSLDQYLQEIALLTNIDKKDVNKVTLMTIHSAKGLEFPIVFVVGMSEGQFPSSYSQDNKDSLEEERRLAYVAYTRAKTRLILTDAGGEDFNGRKRETSRFIDEIDKQDLEGFEEEEKHFTPRKIFVVKKNKTKNIKEDKIHDASIYNPECNIVDCIVADAGRKVRDRYSNKCHGQYFENNHYYDWDDDTYSQGMVDAEDIFDASDFC